MTKPIKITGDPKMIPHLVQSLLEYIGKGKGIKMGYIKNHHTVSIKITERGEFWMCRCWETKTMIVMEWSEL